MVRVTVTVDDDHLAAIGEVAENLRRHGLVVDAVHEAVGVISGSVDGGQKDSLAHVDGVASVDQEIDVQLPPPDQPQ
jgi:hypothetical protein